jgi:flavin reductase (DIM6/NTAB) family NADH-FMN oxidoreductase RutF
MGKVEIPLARCLRLIAPGPVTLITTEARGTPNVSACAWLMPLSSAPPLLALSLAPDSLTHRSLQDSGECVVNVPPRALARETHFCGIASGREVRKDREAGLRLEAAGKVRAPLIAACIGHLECVVREARAAGDHVLYIAEVVLALAESGLFDEAWNPDDEGARTLHHLGGNLYTSSGGRVAIDVRREVKW